MSTSNQAAQYHVHRVLDSGNLDKTIIYDHGSKRGLCRVMSAKEVNRGSRHDRFNEYVISERPSQVISSQMNAHLEVFFVLPDKVA